MIFAERYVTKPDGAIKTETMIPPLVYGRLDRGHVDAEDPAWTVSAAPSGLSTSILRMKRIRRSRPWTLPCTASTCCGKAVTPVWDEANDQAVKVGDLVIPVNFQYQANVNFAGPPGTVPTFPYHDVYNKTMDMSVFKNKIVYVGSTSGILHDNWHTPFADRDAMPGVEIHAQFLDTLVTGKFLRFFPTWMELLVILVLGLMTTLLTFRTSAVQGAIVAAVISGGYAIATFYFFDQDVVLPMVAPLTAVAFSFAGLAVYRGWAEERRARNTRQMFSKYVSKSIVDEIMKNPDAIKLGGEVKEVTILFSDVRGFTAMSEKLSAPEVVEVLNEYLTAMVDIVIANGGTLDKYVGDAIMAVWGSPLYDPEHKQNALRTCVQMMEVLEELKVKWTAEGKPEMDIGIGLNTGHVVAGNMGHPDFKMDYTVIGDDVNLAARMESANKEMRSHVLITGTTYEGCENMVDVIMHPPIHVKGKEKEIDVIEVIGWKNQGRAPWAKPLAH